MRWVALLTAALLASAARAELDAGTVDVDPGEGFTPDEDRGGHEVLRLTGYVDLGFAWATGNGSSFLATDTRAPLDYGVDAFAPAVNSRGEVASADPQGRFTNGFLPRSVGIGTTPSFLLNTVSADVRYQPHAIPVFLFARLQLMPRLLSTGDQTRVELQQAFGRLSPIPNTEFAISLGRFDSVFGIEYLENEANLRVGIVPSLIARYTTGQSLGVKAFYRVQLPALWSALSLNVAATNSGTRVEALVPVDVSLVGVPVGSARLGYELNLQAVQAKLGVSGLYGPRNDQRSSAARQMALGVDARLNLGGLALAGEFLRLVEEPGPTTGKVTGTSTGEFASGFEVWGGWGRVAYTFPWKGEVLTGVTLAVRYDHRKARFEGYVWVETDRLTPSARIDFYDFLALKLEAVLNRELQGAPTVQNDVYTASAVMTW
jgi:hypothetical protein